jgi:hypothetical protein
VLSVALAALLVLSATTGELWLVVAAVGLAQLLVATAPAASGLEHVRSRPFVPVVAGCAVATTLGYDPSLLAGTDGTHAADDALLASGVLAGILVGTAVVVALALLAQMLRRDGRADLVRSVAAAVTLGVLAALGAGWVAAARASASTDVVAAGAIALAVALLVWAVPGDRVLVVSASVVAGAAGGALAPMLVDGPGTWVLGAAVGGSAALAAVLGQVLGRAWTAGRRTGPEGWAFPAGLSVVLVGPVVHVGAQLVVLVV